MGVCDSQLQNIPDPVDIPCVEPSYFNGQNVNLRVVRVACTLGKFTFSNQLSIPCQRIPFEKERCCSHVFVKPMINGKQEIIYDEYILRIYSDVRESIMMVNDCICEMYPARSQIKIPRNGRMVHVDMHTFKHGSNRCLYEVIIISRREYPRATLDDFLAIHRPHCLILILDCPQSLFITFPPKA